MKSTTVLTAIAVLGMTGNIIADTLELRVVGEDDAALVFHYEFTQVNIQGRIVGANDFGLALWGASLSDTYGFASDLSELVLDSPGGDMDQFKRNAGLTNPSGYGGTLIGGNLIQIGGGQNTIGNSGPTLFPTGSVVTNVANGTEWTTLATGWLFTFDLLDIMELQLDTGIASTLSADVGPVFPVTPAGVMIDTTGLTICPLTGAPTVVFGDVYSVAYHFALGTFPGGELDIPIDAADDAAKQDMIEPRQTDAAAGPMAIRVDFFESVISGEVTATPALTGLAATPNGNSLHITFDQPENGTCYLFDLTGTVTAFGVIEKTGCFASTDADFCVCYFEADIDFNSVVNPSDRTVISNGANLFQTMDSPTIFGPHIDIDRNGIINPTDRSLVSSGVNLYNDFTAVSCP